MEGENGGAYDRGVAAAIAKPASVSTLTPITFVLQAARGSAAVACTITCQESSYERVA